MNKEFILQLPVLVDGHIYESGDHYYQNMKIKDLTGTTSEKLMETGKDGGRMK